MISPVHITHSHGAFDALLKALHQNGASSACFQSFCLVGVAELFDKTWFVALLMAVRNPKGIVFTGCYLALVVHTIIAALFGYTVSRAMPVHTLHFLAAGVYLFFAVLYLRDWYRADPSSDIITAGKEEAAESIADDATSYGSSDMKLKKGFAATSIMSTSNRRIFGQCFLAMFIAEWGDRTQIAMIGQHASQPLIPVCVGSLGAFFILTISAVLAGALLSNQRLSEKYVHLFSALSFVVFAGLAVRDGICAESVDMR